MSEEIRLTLPKLHAKQEVVWRSPASEILFAGDTRSGKSFFFRWAFIHYCIFIDGFECDIFRLKHDEVIAENMDGETSLPVLLSDLVQRKLVAINQTEVNFWNGSKISLEHAFDDSIMAKHRGIPKHARAFSESSQIPERRIRALTGWVTMSETMKARLPEEWKGKFPKVFHGTNPVGPTCGYYRRNFVDCVPPYTIHKVGMHLRQYVPAFVDDNPSENEEATRARIAEAFPDEAVQDALISKDKTGIKNWHSQTGEFFPEWDETRHVVEDFLPPTHWFRFRSFDWGTAEPFCCYWIAVSDGEPFRDREGQERWFPRGAFVFYNEWYGCDAKDPAKGNRMRNADIAAGIVSRSELGFENVVTLTDSKPFQDMGGEGIAKEFKDNGCTLDRADTSRVSGWNQVRSRLIGKEWDSNATLDGKPIKLPMAYFTECCIAARDYMPALGRHPRESKKEDAAEHGEATHSPDAIRYGCMAHTVIKDRLEPVNSHIERIVKNDRVTVNKLLQQNGMRAL